MVDSFHNNTVTNLPDINKIEFISVDKSYLKVIFINFFLFFVPLFIGLVLADLFLFSDDFKEFMIYIYPLFAVFFGFILVYLILGFSKRKYALREKDISYKCGLLVKKITTVPFSRIQHVEIDEKPVSRIFGLSALSVYTAGDSSDDLVIKGIKKEKASQIKEFISTKINE